MIIRYASGLGWSSVAALRPTTWYWFIFPHTVIFHCEGEGLCVRNIMWDMIYMCFVLLDIVVVQCRRPIEVKSSPVQSSPNESQSLCSIVGE